MTESVMTGWKRWLTGALLAALMAVAYVVLWRPARAYVTQQVVYPAFAALQTERAQRFRLVPAGPRAIEVTWAHSSLAVPGEVPPAYQAPAGILFLLPALFLIAAYPHRPYWVYFALWHVVLGTLSFTAIYVGIGWSGWGFAAHAFLLRYFIPATSLGAPALVWAYERSAKGVKREA